MAYAVTVAAGLGGGKRPRALYDQEWHQVTPHTGDCDGSAPVLCNALHAMGYVCKFQGYGQMLLGAGLLQTLLVRHL